MAARPSGADRNLAVLPGRRRALGPVRARVFGAAAVALTARGNRPSVCTSATGCCERTRRARSTPSARWSALPRGAASGTARPGTMKAP